MSGVLGDHPLHQIKITNIRDNSRKNGRPPEMRPLTMRTPKPLGVGVLILKPLRAPPVDDWGGALALGRRWFELRRLCIATDVGPVVRKAPATEGTNGGCESAGNQVCGGTMGPYDDVNLGCHRVQQR